MKILNRYGNADYWRALAQAFEDRYEHGDWAYSSTNLVSPIRQFFLSTRHADEIEQDVTDLGAITLGHCVHFAVEMLARGTDVVEERFVIAVNGVKIGAKPDRLVRLPQVGRFYNVRDIKVCKCSALMRRQKIEWIRQLNINALCAGVMGYPCVSAHIDAYLKDWELASLARMPNVYPQKPLLPLQVTLWPAQEVKAWVAKRVLEFERAKDLADDDLPECTAEERWASNDLWAVKKQGGAKAIKGGAGFKSEHEAERFAQAQSAKHPCEVEFRPGNSIRCKRYCNAAPFCNQYARLKALERKGADYADEE